MPLPYERFKQDELILRDELAVDRTLLANERTLLAYLRGALSLLLAGVTFIHFARHPWFTVLGVVCLPLGVAMGIFGWRRYRAMDAAISVLRQKIPQLPAD